MARVRLVPHPRVMVLFDGKKIDGCLLVMKKIMGLTTIPLNDKYEFTKRAGKLMHQVMSFLLPLRFTID